MRFLSKNARLLLLAAAGLLLAPVWASAQAPDMILYNGKIATVDSNFSYVQAVAIAGNKIAATGTNEAIQAMAGPNTTKLDLKGRTVIPGIIDTHRHMYGAAEGQYGGALTDDDLRRYPVDWAGVKTKEDVLNQIRNVMAKWKFAPGRWIYLNNRVSFMGNNDPNSPSFAKILYDELNADELAKVTPNNPVMMSLGIPDFNGFLVNRKALDWAMSTHGDFIKKNGRFWVDAQGRPDGHLEPPASRLILPFSYDRKAEVLAPLYEKNMKEHLAMGMTGISTRMPLDSLAAYDLLDKQGKLTWRIGWGNIEDFGNTDLDKPGANMKALVAKIGKGVGGKESDHLWMTGSGPTAVDGTSSRACTDQKRTGQWTPIDSWFPMGQCHTDVEYKGSPKRAANISENYYANWVMLSGRDGLRFANTHVAGDRATGNMLNFIEKLQQQYGPKATENWGLDHCDMVNPKDFPRIAKTGVFMSCYVLTSIRESPDIARAYGDQIANTFPSPLNSMVKAGGRVVLESDSASYVWQDIHAAVTRKDRTGKVWAPQERVTPEVALKMFTIWAAQYVLKGDKLGSIEKGKLADLVVLDKDMFTMNPDDLDKVQPQLTIWDGKPVFVHTDFANENNYRPAGATISSYDAMVKARTTREGVNTGG